MAYKPSINALRGLSVLLVILYHAGWVPFTAGYVGVDIFLFISGYIIFVTIADELNQQHFDVFGFCERRVRRIVPALVLVCLASFVFAFFTLFPDEFRLFSFSLIAAAVQSSNLYFWKKIIYFEDVSKFTPLLHTWSLGVEVQYYALFALLLAVIKKSGLKGACIAFLMIAGISFSIDIYGHYFKLTSAFYLMPARAWEFAVGAIVALLERRWFASPRQAVTMRQQICGLAGLGMILAGARFADTRVLSLVPAGLLPILGAALFTLAAPDRSLAGQLLANPILRGLGRISYSLYLWHLPLLVFADILTSDRVSIVQQFGLILLAVALSILSWRFVEQPFREGGHFRFRRWPAIGMAGGACALLALLGVAGVSHPDRAGPRLTAEQQAILGGVHYDFTRPYRAGTCFLMEQHGRPGDFPSICAGHDGLGGVMVWGDSHAAALSAGLRMILPAVGQYSVGLCPPFVEVPFHDDNHAICRRTAAIVLAAIARQQPDILILHANWMLYQALDLPASLRDTLAAIRRVAPQTRLIVLGGVPQWWPSLPQAMVRNGIGRDLAATLSSPVMATLRQVDHSYQSVAEQGGARFVSALDLLCPGASCSVIAPWAGGGELVAWDYGHLTLAGAVRLATRLCRQIGCSSVPMGGRELWPHIDQGRSTSMVIGPAARPWMN